MDEQYAQKTGLEIVQKMTGDKWKFLIITHLFNRNLHFSELLYSVDSITKKVLLDNLGVVLVEDLFEGSLTLLENGRDYGKYYSRYEEKILIEYLGRFDLNSNQAYRKLSKGQKLKFQLAFALAHAPKLLLLDEPTGGLDPVFRQEFLQLMQREVREKMMSVIISTHLTADLDKVADYVMLLDKGESVFYLDKEEMMDSYPLVSGTVEQLTLLDQKQCGRIRRTHGTFTTMFKNPAYLKENPRLREQLQVERTTIEEMMYYLCEGELS